jgi:hypothetical protein
MSNVGGTSKDFMYRHIFSDKSHFSLLGECRTLKSVNVNLSHFTSNGNTTTQMPKKIVTGKDSSSLVAGLNWCSHNVSNPKETTATMKLLYITL